MYCNANKGANAVLPRCRCQRQARHRRAPRTTAVAKTAALSRCLIDTGILSALADTDGAWHTRAVEFVSGFRGQLIAPSAVIPEICHLLNSYLSTKAEVAFVHSLANHEISVEHFNDRDLGNPRDPWPIPGRKHRLRRRCRRCYRRAARHHVDLDHRSQALLDGGRNTRRRSCCCPDRCQCTSARSTAARPTVRVRCRCVGPQHLRWVAGIVGLQLGGGFGLPRRHFRPNTSIGLPRAPVRGARARALWSREIKSAPAKLFLTLEVVFTQRAAQRSAHRGERAA